jgi:hypothetical protein
MVIKVEVYYEVVSKGDTKLPPNLKSFLEEFVRQKCPKDCTFKGDFAGGEKVTATKLSQEQLLERIRTAK